MKYKLLAGSCRWTARIIGGGMAFCGVFIAIAEHMPLPSWPPTLNDAFFFALLLLLLGLIAGWRWELAGGIMALAGSCLFLILVLIKKGITLSAFTATLPGALIMGLPGVLFLASALLRAITKCKRLELEIKF